jgi:hypothetical protein
MEEKMTKDKKLLISLCEKLLKMKVIGPGESDLIIKEARGEIDKNTLGFLISSYENGDTYLWISPYQDKEEGQRFITNMMSKIREEMDGEASHKDAYQEMEGKFDEFIAALEKYRDPRYHGFIRSLGISAAERALGIVNGKRDEGRIKFIGENFEVFSGLPVVVPASSFTPCYKCACRCDGTSCSTGFTVSYVRTPSRTDGKGGI